MRVLYIHQHFSTHDGTTGVRSYKMARRLIANGHDVTMLCGSYDRSDTGLTGPFSRGIRRGSRDGIDVVELDLAYSNSQSLLSRSVVFLKFAILACWVALTEKCDVIVATSTPLTVGIPAVVGRVFRRKCLVFEIRDLWPELPRAMGVITNPVVLAGLAALEWLVYRCADRLIGLSKGMVDGIVARGVSEFDVKLIPNGCDFDLFQDAATLSVRPAPFGDDDLVAIYAGSHGVANGLDAVIAAANELRRRGDLRVKFLFVGDGSQKQSLRQSVIDAGLEDRVVFLEPVGKSELAGLIQGADVGIQCLANVEAFYEGTSPNKFFDYIASGKPVLVNYPGWVRDLILEDDCGWAVDPDDPAGFADALQEAAASREETLERGERALLLAHRRFDRAVLSETFSNWVTLGK